MRLSMFSMKWLFSAFAVLVAVMGLGFLVSGKQSLYGQVPGNRVPDLRGRWDFYAPNFCAFRDVLDKTVPPVPICTTQSGTPSVLRITAQTGRVFAGDHINAPDKLTGFLAPDGTVSIQYFSPSDHEMERIFLTGTLKIQGDKYVISGYAHGYSDLTIASPNRPYMQTIEFYATKQ